MAEYVWIDGSGITLRLKNNYTKENLQLADIPEWNYEGSSCY